MPRFCRAPCLRDFRFFAVCLKLHFSNFTMKTNGKAVKNDVLGSHWRPGSSSRPRRAVRICFCCLICLFCVLSSIRSPVVSCGLLGSPGLSWALLGSPGLFWGLLGTIGLSWALVSSPGLSWALLGSPRLSWALLEMCSRPSVIPGCGVLTT